MKDKMLKYFATGAIAITAGAVAYFLLSNSGNNEIQAKPKNTQHATQEKRNAPPTPPSPPSKPSPPRTYYQVAQNASLSSSSQEKRYPASDTKKKKKNNKKKKQQKAKLPLLIVGESGVISL